MMGRAALTLIAAAAVAGSAGATYSAFSETTSSAGNALTASDAYCPSSHTESATADAWVDQNATSANNGGDTTLKLRSLNKKNARVLVRFNLPARPPGCNVTAAKLRLSASSASGGRTLEARANTGGWTEGGVTWSNQPATTNTGLASTGSGTGYLEWTVTTQVQNMYSGTNNGFQLRDSSENNSTLREQQLKARDAGSEPPELVVTFG